MAIKTEGYGSDLSWVGEGGGGGQWGEGGGQSSRKMGAIQVCA